MASPSLIASGKDNHVAWGNDGGDTPYSIYFSKTKCFILE